MSVTSVAKGYRDKLVAANIRATLDPRDVQPPCVLFQPATITLDLNCGGTAQMQAILLVPGPGTGEAWEHLDQLLPAVLDVIPAETITPDYIDGRGDHHPIPAYQLAWSQAVSYDPPTPGTTP